MINKTNIYVTLAVSLMVIILPVLSRSLKLNTSQTITLFATVLVIGLAVIIFPALRQHFKIRNARSRNEASQADRSQ